MHLKLRSLKAIGIVLALLIGVFAGSNTAHADLTIMPVRVVFEERDRSAELVLVNTSNTTNTYRLEWLNNRVNEDGSYASLTEPLDPLFKPDEVFVVSPRQVTIPPGQQQRVRLSLRRPPNLAVGEYRAHLAMRKVDQQSRAVNTAIDGVAAALNINVGFSIPVIVRQGAYNAQATISDIKIQPASAGGNPQLLLNINRQGTHSLSGRIRVKWTPPGGSEEDVGLLNNVNVFHEVPLRKARVNLKSSRPITGGSMRVIYETMDTPAALLAERTLPLQ